LRNLAATGTSAQSDQSRARTGTALSYLAVPTSQTMSSNIEQRYWLGGSPWFLPRVPRGALLI
jgi:hypothetical protein